MPRSHKEEKPYSKEALLEAEQLVYGEIHESDAEPEEDFAFDKALKGETPPEPRYKGAATNREAIMEYREMLRTLTKAQLVELVVQERMTIEFLRRSYSWMEITSVPTYAARQAVLKTQVLAKKTLSSSGGAARWEKDPIQRVKAAIEAEWKKWTANRRGMPYPRDFRREMMNRFPEVVDGTLKNWMSQWGRAEKP